MYTTYADKMIHLVKLFVVMGIGKWYSVVVEIAERSMNIKEPVVENIDIKSTNFVK